VSGDGFGAYTRSWLKRHHVSVDHSRIANLAYAYWQERGRPFGSPDIDWLRAEARIGRPVQNELPPGKFEFRTGSGCVGLNRCDR
jgi:Protein of unknown function (DUF2934)